MDSFTYQYLVGGLVFLVGLVFAFRQGYLGFSGRGFRRLIILLGGFCILMAIQGYLQYGHMETLPFMGDASEAICGDEVCSAGETRCPRDCGQGIIGVPIDYAVMIGYFIAILAIGTYFGRRQKSTRDFFFAGQRFSWWLVAFSLVATTIGSYSFVKYSRVAYGYGLSSSQTYLNDWFWVPLFLFGWLPILYFTRITSIPEYFERRFGPVARAIATALLLVYLVGYVGVNLFTMGTALNILIGWPVFWSACLVAVISATYVTFGGQTSVIMTDLFQGVMLLATGVVLLVLGIDYLGGFSDLWENLPRAHRYAFANFNTDPEFPSVGLFWQDAMANTAMFYFLNQGVLMRFMAAKSVNEGRKAALTVPIVLMPLAAIAVASGGWVGKALSHAGILPPLDPDAAFFVTAEFLSHPGIFGLIMAALTAALMSTVDSLVTGVAAIIVNDVYKPVRKKAFAKGWSITRFFRGTSAEAGERDMLAVARWTSVSVAVIGLLLVPVFMTFESIYTAHGAFTAAVTPPLVIALLFSVFWRRFTRPAAVWTMAGGAAAIILSIAFPVLVEPFAWGVPADDAGHGILAGMKQFKFTRAFFGLSVSAAIGIIVTLFTRPEREKRQRGLVWTSISDALARYKGSPGEEVLDKKALAKPVQMTSEEFAGEASLSVVNISKSLAEALAAKPGDLLYVSDSRRWLGGLHSCHVTLGEVLDDAEGHTVEMGPEAWEAVVVRSRRDKPVRVERLY